MEHLCFHPRLVLFLHQLTIAAFLNFLIAEAAGLVYLIVGVAAFEVEHFAVAFKGKDVSTDAVEDPTVVADHYRTASKGFKTFLKGAERIDVDVVGWLVEKQHVAFLLQGKG